MSYKVCSIIAKIITYLFLIIIVIISIFPVVFTFSGSFKDTIEVLTSGSLFPQNPTVKNYITAWKSIDFFRYTLNSVIISFFSVFGVIIMSSMTAYVLDRKSNIPGCKFLSGIYVAAIFVAIPIATIYPIFNFIISLSLNRTLLGQILIAASGQCTFIFMIQGYLRGVPIEIDSAAKIDGCGFFKTYCIIILPLIKPIIATVAVLSFKSVWNSYLLPSVVTMGVDYLKPLTVAIVDLKSSGMQATDTGLMLAGASISIIPMILVFLIANKQFLGGLTTGAVKG